MHACTHTHNRVRTNAIDWYWFHVLVHERAPAVFGRARLEQLQQIEAALRDEQKGAGEGGGGEGE